MKVLITGGAGFIGSHLVDKLIEKGYSEVTIFDNLEEQVHGKLETLPSYINKKAKFIKSSVINYNTFEKAIKESDIIVHLAATVGVAQSMYQVEKYVNTNILGTANLLDILNKSKHKIDKLIIASSNTIYGEGKYFCSKCGITFPPVRSISQLTNHDWEVKCPNCQTILTSVPTDESSVLNPSSIYAFTKQSQEQLSLLIGKTYNIDFTILRFFLVYGSRQSISNPYTGVCNIFATNILNNRSPMIYEDGLQSRDFVNVNDVCQAIILSMEKEEAKGQIFNVGTGIPIKIKEVAELFIKKLNSDLDPLVTQKYRMGDIRHCIADITKIKKFLGFKPSIAFKDGIDDLINWIQREKGKIQDKSQLALNELKEKGLLR